MQEYPNILLHWISDTEEKSVSGASFEKVNPASGDVIARVVRGNAEDVSRALTVARASVLKWSSVPVVRRSDLLREAALLIRSRKTELAYLVAVESGKSLRASLGEVDAAIECGLFFAGEGRRYGGEVLTSAIAGRHVFMVRQSIGVGALITPFNNPAAGIAWKLFPALLCGNAVVVKSHERTPAVALWYARLLKDVGLPSGVLSVLQGYGLEVGLPLVQDSRVRFVSFTGSVATARSILSATAQTLAKTSVETGGKNAFVVCDDADIPRAVSTAIQAAFVDGGQRCAAASRIIIMDSVYDQFKKLFLEAVDTIHIGTDDTDMYGAIVGDDRLQAIEHAVAEAAARGAVVLRGGSRVLGDNHQTGSFMCPAVLEDVAVSDSLWREELFGPVVILHRAGTFENAVALANEADFKLSSAVHTGNMDRAMTFATHVEAGVVRINGPTHGSEPHMPFGGIGISGNGWREPGTKALDFYSEWKQVSVDTDTRNV